MVASQAAQPHLEDGTAYLSAPAHQGAINRDLVKMSKALNGGDREIGKAVSNSAQQVQLLANLLERAIGSMVVTHDRSKQRIDIPTYRKKLLSHWNRHWPDLDLNHPRHYTHTIASDELHEELLATVCRELAPHVRDGRVQTAAIVTVGGYGPGFTLVDLVGRLAEVAIGRGPWHAARAFYEGAQGADATYRYIALLTGVRLDHEVVIRPGIRMVPMPNSTR